MKATLIYKRRHDLDEDAYAEMVIWRVPKPVKGSTHGYRYRLAYVVNEDCALRYDNEAGKGDHRHVGGVEIDYAFSDPETLMADFWNDVARWNDENRGP
jgi:hypothetical protein